MNWIKWLFGSGESQLQSQVKYDANGKAISIEVPPGEWEREQKGPSIYYTQRASSLLEATEILKQVDRISNLTYYVVVTPDGSLGRDMNGFYTEAPINTENITVAGGRDNALKDV